MRRLIVNADDLGLTEGVNRAILRAHTNGIVTSATLMANGAALDNAVGQLRTLNGKQFSVGCHLVLVDGTPLSPAEKVPTLLKGAEFRRGVGALGLAARSRKLSPPQIELEAEAQFRTLQSRGISLSHFDAHKHSHMFPEILEPALRAAAKCGIRAIRNPFESGRPLPFSIFARYPKLLKRYMQVKLLRSMRSSWRKIVAKFGLATPDGSLGVIVTGDLNDELLRTTLEHMPDGTWELVCHPGYNDEALGSVRTRLRASREAELALLTSNDTKRLIERLGIELISYSQL